MYKQKAGNGDQELLFLRFVAEKMHAQKGAGRTADQCAEKQGAFAVASAAALRGKALVQKKLEKRQAAHQEQPEWIKCGEYGYHGCTEASGAVMISGFVSAGLS